MTLFDKLRPLPKKLVQIVDLQNSELKNSEIGRIIKMNFARTVFWIAKRRGKSGLN